MLELLTFILIVFIGLLIQYRKENKRNRVQYIVVMDVNQYSIYEVISAAKNRNKKPSKMSKTEFVQRTTTDYARVR
jgi:hypothetical protein